MRFLTIFLLGLFSISALGDEVKVEISPQAPVAGEIFQAKFRIFTSSSEDPEISFTSGKTQIMGKSNQGVSTRTVYANGSLTVTREVIIVYDLMTKLLGSGFLRDIKVKVGDKILTHPSVSFNVVKEPVEKSEVFIQADVPKREVYLGEGVTVRYYLYSKLPVNALDIKRYPKLNNFLKRFLQEPDRMERVSVDGEIFLRSQIYAAKLFPEKVGDLKVDPLTISVTYQVAGRNDPFGSFGLQREFRTRTFNSEQVIVKVKPLPQPVPDHFTGLVGKHDFNLNFSQSKLIVNEPLEVRLTVSGPGALENLEAPVLLRDPALEEFETTGDLKITDPELATKTFQYTFLAKSNLSLPGKEKLLSYLDPESGRYITTNLQIPELTIAGGKAVPSVSKDKPSPEQKLPSEQAPLKLNPPELMSLRGVERYLGVLNLSLAFIALSLLGLFFVFRVNFSALLSPRDIPASFRKGKFSFGEFARWLDPVIKTTGKSPESILKDPRIDGETREYFKDLLRKAEKDFSSKKGEMTYSYKAKHFKTLAKYIESSKHENSQITQ